MDLTGRIFNMEDQQVRANEAEVEAYRKQQAYFAARDRLRLRQPAATQAETTTTAAERAIARNAR